MKPFGTVSTGTTVLALTWYVRWVQTSRWLVHPVAAWTSYDYPHETAFEQVLADSIGSYAAEGVSEPLLNHS